MIDHISTISVGVSDQERALDFYTNALGFEVRQDNAMSNGVRFLMVGPPNGQAGIVLFPNGEGDQPGSSFGTVLDTADIAATHEQLAAKGVQFIEEPTKQEWGGIQAQFTDPDGNHFVLIQLPDFMRG